MFNSIKQSIATGLALILSSFVCVADAQNTAPSFFGSGSQPSVPPKTAAAAKPSTSQVWSKDDFTKNTTQLNSKRETNFQNKLNASLKPMPAKNAPVSTPTPAGGFNSSGGASAPAVQNPSTPSTSSSAATPSTPASTATPSSGYTGFGSGTQQKTPAQTNSSSGGWNVNY